MKHELPDKGKKRKVKPRNSRYHKEDNKVSRQVDEEIETQEPEFKSKKERRNQTK